MVKLAIRFKVLHRDRSIRLMTEGLGPKPFHGHVVMVVSAGEMVAAFAKENGLARIVGTRTGGQVLGGANFAVGRGFVLRFPRQGGTHGAAPSSKDVACNPTLKFRYRCNGFSKGRTVSLNRRSADRLSCEDPWRSAKY